MATLNLGRIKPVFRGAYAGGTAYVVDDIVTSGDETFICILASTGNATSNATYWTKLAAKGTDGTDLTSTLTTQGDILYRDGSGLQRLAAGTDGQYLKTQGTGANPVWGTVASGAKFGQIVTNESDAAVSSITSVSSFADFTSSPTVTITPTATSSKVLVEFNFVASGGGSGNGFDIAIFDDSNNKLTTTGLYGSKTNGFTIRYLHTANTTSAVTYRLRGQVNSGGGHHLYLYAQTSNPLISVYCSATEILA